VLEDEFRLVNVLVKPGLYEGQRSLIRTKPFVVMREELQRRDGTANVLADRSEVLCASRALNPEDHNLG
jgi:hypothetical protein